jgi:hypothetical protein
LNNAKREAGTEYDAVAFTAICLNYLSGGAVKPPDLEEVMKANGITEVFTAIDALWPDINIQILADTLVVKQEHLLGEVMEIIPMPNHVKLCIRYSHDAKRYVNFTADPDVQVGDGCSKLNIIEPSGGIFW